MKKQLFIIGIVAILVSAGLSGCNEESSTLSPEENKFVGSWVNATTQGDSMQFKFFSDGTYKVTTYLNTSASASGTWDAIDGTLFFRVSDTNEMSQVFYVFSNNNQTLSLTDQQDDHYITIVFTKQ